MLRVNWNPRLSKEVTRLYACTTIDQVDEIVGSLVEDVLKYYSDQAARGGLEHFSETIRKDMDAIGTGT